VDQYGAKKMLQIFNMNPTTEDVAKRFLNHGNEGSVELEKKNMFVSMTVLPGFS